MRDALFNFDPTSIIHCQFIYQFSVSPSIRQNLQNFHSLSFLSNAIEHGSRILRGKFPRREAGARQGSVAFT